jgi:hypothetical protein
MHKALILLGIGGSCLFADTVPTMNAAAFNASIYNFSTSYNSSGDNFNLVGGYALSGSTITDDGYPLEMRFYVGVNPMIDPSVTGSVTVDGQTIGARYYGSGGRIVPNDTANYEILVRPGIYSFPATVTASFTACELIPAVVPWSGTKS